MTPPDPTAREAAIADRERSISLAKNIDACHPADDRGEVTLMARHFLAAEKRAEEMAARVKVLEAALKPFAEAFDGDDDFPKDEWELWGRPETMNLTVRDLRKACQAYNGSAALAQETPHE